MSHPKHLVEEARRLRETGMGYRKVANHLGINLNTVSAWLRGTRRQKPQPRPENRKLTNEQVLLIRQMVRQNIRASVIMRELNLDVTYGTLQKAANGTTYADLPGAIPDDEIFGTLAYRRKHRK